MVVQLCVFHGEKLCSLSERALICLREGIGIDTIYDVVVDDARAESPESVRRFRRLLHRPDCSLCSSQLLGLFYKP